MYGLMNPLCWSRSALINSHEQIPLFPQCCLDKLQFHLTLDSNFNGFHRTTVNTSPGIRWLNCKARSVFPASSSCSCSSTPPPVCRTPHKTPSHTLNHYLYFHTCASCTNQKATIFVPPAEYPRHTYIYICANSKHIYPWILLLFVSLTGSNKMVTGSDLSPVIMIFCDILHPCQFSINYRPWKTCCLIKTNCLDREGQGNLFIIW